MTTTKIQLDLMAAHGCETPGCDHRNHDGTIFLHSRCHPGAPVVASYTLRSGVVQMVCAVCQKLVAQIKVAND